MRILNSIGAFIASFGIAMVGSAVIFTVFDIEMTDTAIWLFPLLRAAII